MENQVFLIAVAGLVFALLFALGLILGLRLGRRSGRLEAERDLPEILEADRGAAIRRSRAVIGGQLAEQVAPLLPGFPCDPGDARFVGKPIDFVAFPGASSGEVEEILFIEVKSGRAGLSRVERSVRDAVQDGRVRWECWRAPGQEDRESGA